MLSRHGVSPRASVSKMKSGRRTVVTERESALTLFSGPKVRETPFADGSSYLYQRSEHVLIALFSTRNKLMSIG